MTEAKANKIINNCLNGIFMKRMINLKGWTKQEARQHLVDFVNCGQKISMYDFMMSK